MFENDICIHIVLVGDSMQNIDLTVLFEVFSIIFGLVALAILLARSKQDKNVATHTNNSEIAVLQKSLDETNRRLELLARTTMKEQAQASEVTKDIQARVSAMNDVMVNKNSRGSWGEYQLEFLLSIYLGQSRAIFETQYPLSNGTIVDAAMHLPNTNKVLPLDSKFPLDSYSKILKANSLGDKQLESRMSSLFISDVKRHINDIRNKYVVAPEAVGQAVMFVPSEAIYTYICSSSTDLLDYALSNSVLICSPTTLIGVTSTVVSATKEFEQVQNMDEIIELMSRIGQDAIRLEDRANKLSLRERQLAEEIEKVAISSRKLASNIDRLVH